ncbi:MAG: hypothetical protein V4864_04490 [Pseudomonadota bacterium]
MKHALILIAALLAGFLAPAGAQLPQRESIIWVAPIGFSPYTIAEGPEKGQGIIDKATEIIVKRLPGMDYEFMPASTLRLFELIKAKPNVCTGVALRNAEREQFFEFTSNAVVKILPNGIITTRSNAAALKPYINDGGELRLDAVLAEGKHRLAVSKRIRTYGPRIDAMLETPAFQNSIVRLDETGMASRLMKLAIQRGQAEYDMIIGYPVELKSKLAELKVDEKDFSFIPIAGETALVSLPVSCSKSPLGKQYVAAVDKLLAEPAFQRQMGQLYRHWLDAETAARYEKLLRREAGAR